MSCNGRISEISSPDGALRGASQRGARHDAARVTTQRVSQRVLHHIVTPTYIALHLRGFTHTRSCVATSAVCAFYHRWNCFAVFV